MTTTVTLVSCDNEAFEVDVATAEQSRTVKNMLDDLSEERRIPLPNVDSKVLASVVQYMKFLADGSKSPEERENFIKQFVGVDQDDLFKLILAANYLNIGPMLDVTCKAVADLIKGKAPDEIRREFGLDNDFTPEEEEEIRRENQWAFD